jgi:predicted nucleic acid-binding Zn finger protein
MSMFSEAFLRKKEELFEKLKRTRILTQELEHAIEDVYGERGRRAIETIKGGGVVKRGRRWFVRGRKNEYEIVRTFCSCRDYVMNIVTGKAGVDMCYHALAKNICESLNAYYISKPGEDRDPGGAHR